MRIAVVHDYFTQLGGAEKVAEELFRILPGASLLSTVALGECMPDALKNVDIDTSWMQQAPGIAKYYRLYFLLYPLAIRSLDLSGYELIVSSSSGYAKGIRTRWDALHVCYCHTPMRWVWDLDRYSQRETMSAGVKAILPQLISWLRRWDEAASRQPDHFIANSRTVAERIKVIYKRKAEIIYPPIDLHRFQMSEEDGDHYLILSRLVSYKRLDLAIKACTRLNRKLLVIGGGPHRESLQAEAGPSVTFCGRLSDAEVNYQVARCRALIFPGEEDFGMAPLEVAAAGKPCIAYRAGGATETIVEGVTGAFFDKQDVDSVATAILQFERQSWSALELRRHSESFSIDVFQEKMRSFLTRVGVPARALNELTPVAGSVRCPEPCFPFEWNQDPA
jgi:glycosyltransferase involved in cell wall biosynthesis